MIDFSFVANFGFLSYFLVFILLAMSGIGILLSEDLLLVFVGYLVHKGIFFFPIALLVCFLGVLAADFVGFHLGSRGFGLVKRLISRKRNIRRKLREPVNIFVSRFIPSVRAVLPIAAGFYGVKWRQFFRWNIVAASVFVPLLIGVGLFAGPKINEVISYVVKSGWVLLALALVVVGVFVVKLTSRSNA